MSSPVDKSNSPKPRTRQSYAAPPIPPSRFLPCPYLSSPTFSSNRPQERSPLTCNPNPFEPLSPNPTPTTKQTYASPSTPPLKTPFNIVASSFPLQPLPLTNQRIDPLPLKKPNPQKKTIVLNSQKILGILFYGLNQNIST